MPWLDMVRAAVAELGMTASSEQISGFVRHRFNQAIDPRFVPFHVATLRGQEQLRLARERAAQIVAEEAEKPVRRKKAG